MDLTVAALTFDCPPLETIHAPLKVAGKRYTTGSSAENKQGITLLFAHCIGGHKEQWEPIIEAIFRTQQTKSPAHRVREAWAFDWHNHGDSAVLNQKALQNKEDGVSVSELAAFFAQFVRSDIMKGHRIVPLGHSAGGACCVLSLKSFSNLLCPYAAVILIEPTMVGQELFYGTFDDRMLQMEFTYAATMTRRDVWFGRDEAFKWMSKRFPWVTWDPRVLRALVEYGLKDSPDGKVTLKCVKEQEAISYPDVDPHFEAAQELGRICSSVPVHIIWGGENDLVPEIIQDSLADASKGRTVASVRRVEDAGHMVVQQKPDALAEVICAILDSIGSTSKARL